MVGSNRLQLPYVTPHHTVLLNGLFIRHDRPARSFRGFKIVLPLGSRPASTPSVAAGSGGRGDPTGTRLHFRAVTFRNCHASKPSRLRADGFQSCRLSRLPRLRVVRVDIAASSGVPYFTHDAPHVRRHAAFYVPTYGTHLRDLTCAPYVRTSHGPVAPDSPDS